MLILQFWHLRTTVQGITALSLVWFTSFIYIFSVLEWYENFFLSTWKPLSGISVYTQRIHQLCEYGTGGDEPRWPQGTWVVVQQAVRRHISPHLGTSAAAEELLHQGSPTLNCGEMFRINFWSIPRYFNLLDVQGKCFFVFFYYFSNHLQGYPWSSSRYKLSTKLTFFPSKRG